MNQSKTMKLKILTLLALLALIAVPAAASDSVPAHERINAAATRYLRGDISATFSYSGAMGSGNGSLRASGKKFALETGAGSCWYDGSQMWTYSPQTQETTLVKPTGAEVAEANPLYVLSGKAGRFTAAYAPKQTPGSYTIILTPKGSSQGIGRVVVVLDAKTLQPRKLDVTTSDGSRAVLTVKSLTKGGRHAAGAFTYPAKRYPKAKIVDLR